MTLSKLDVLSQDRASRVANASATVAPHAVGSYLESPQQRSMHITDHRPKINVNLNNIQITIHTYNGFKMGVDINYWIFMIQIHFNFTDDNI